MKLGRLGVWATTEGMTAAAAATFARQVESWGYAALWIPESVGRNALVHASWLLANTERLLVATGIANIYGRDALAMRSAQLTLDEQSNGRFLLGVGVSHVHLVEGLRGHSYAKPIETMRCYLEAMGSAAYQAPKPAQPSLTLLAALGPKMLALSAERADGAHPYLITPQHTAEARAILGPGKLLCPEQKVLLQADPVKARAAARKSIRRYLSLPNYRNNLTRLGFAAADFDEGGSDRLVDALVAWGDEAAIRLRLQQHWDAGADHVCIQAVHPDEAKFMLPDEKLLAILAPAGGS